MSVDPILRILLLLGALIYLGIILWMLKRKKLNVQYSIIWLISAVVLILFALFPHIVSVMRDILNIETSANFIFLALFAFVLLLLLSLSTIVTGFAGKIKRLAQTQALLEKRVRELENQLGSGPANAETRPGAGEDG